MPVIVRVLKKQGPATDWSLLWRSKFPDVATSTYYRWVNEAKALYGNKKAREFRGQAKPDPRRDEVGDEAEQRFIATLPAAPEPGDIASMSAPDIGAKLNACVLHAEQVLSALAKETDEGTEIQDPIIYLKASDHLRRSVETMAKISELIWDVRRTEAFHAKIFEVIRAHDPAIVRQITRALEQLNQEWGLA